VTETVTYIGPEATRQDVEVTGSMNNEKENRMDYTLKTKDGKPFLDNKLIPGHQLEHKTPAAEPSALPPVQASSQERKNLALSLFEWFKPRH